MKEASDSEGTEVPACKQEKASKSESALLIIMGSHTRRWAPVSS